MEAKELRIVYMGTPDFAVEPLLRLVEGGYNIVGIVTVPDKPAGRGLKIQQSAVKQYAASVLPGIPMLQPVRLKDPEFVASFAALEADLAVVVAFRMLPEVIWGGAKYGTFNLHASLLPQYRGAAPINWAVINGESVTGVTTFLLNHEIDCGSRLMQRELPISETDTAGTVHDKLMDVGAGLVVETVDAIAAGRITPMVQPVGLSSSISEGLKPAPKIFKEDCRLVAPDRNWVDYPVREVYDKVRGLSPYPGAWCDFPGAANAVPMTAKILGVHYEVFPEGGPVLAMGMGVAVPTIVTKEGFESDGKSWLRVACRDGWLYVDHLQLAGKRAMEVGEFLRGHRF